MNTQPRLTKVVVIGTDAERKDYTGVAEHLKDKGILIIENPCDSFIPTACVRIDPFFEFKQSMAKELVKSAKMAHGDQYDWYRKLHPKKKRW